MALSLTRIFPVPTWLRKEAAGLDFSDNILRYVWLRPKGSDFYVHTFKGMQLPEGMIKDGMPTDVEGFKQALISLKKEVSMTTLRVVLPEEQVFVFRITVPVKLESDIEDAVRLKIEEFVPMKAQDAHITWHIMKHDDAGYDVTVQAVSEVYLQTLYTIFSSAGFEVIDFEFEGQSVLRLFPLVDKVYMILVAGVSTATLFIVHQNLVHFSSSVGVEGQKMLQEVDKAIRYWDDSHEQHPITTVYCLGQSQSTVSRTLTLGIPVIVPTTELWQTICDVNKSIPSITAGEVGAYAGALGAARGVYQ